MGQRVFVLIPAYNAAETVADVFARVPPEAQARITRFVAINDGSTDQTGEILGRIADREPKLQVIQRTANFGYGAAVCRLLQEGVRGEADVAIVLHSDGQYPPEKIPEILSIFDRDEADLVQGSRMLDGGALEGGMPLYKYVANRALTAIENAAFGLNLAEYHSGYLSYSRRFLESVPFDRLSQSFDYDLEMMVLALVCGLRIKEIPIPTRYADEKSHLNPIPYGLRCLRVVYRYRTGHYRRLAGRG
jgi:glycosyltransferase involved in cell wall biosynthesis